MTTANRFVSDVVAAACGHWPDVLAGLGIDTPHRGKHGPCPVCGGTDRFRLDDKAGRGTWICNQCDPQSGDGLDLVCRVIGKGAKAAAEMIAPLVGLSGAGLAPAERERIVQQQQAKAEATRKEAERQRKQAATRARSITDAAYSGVSPYLKAKGLPEHHQHMDGDTAIIPLVTEAGYLVNVQRISAQGEKRYLSRGQKAGAFHRIDGGELVAVVEGYATGLSVHLATGATVYCAMDSGNLPAVTEIARRRHPEAQILLCGDNDAMTPGNPGKSKAEQSAAVVGGLVALPPAAGDWNDYHQAHGLTATQEAIMSASNRTTTSSRADDGSLLSEQNHGETARTSGETTQPPGCSSSHPKDAGQKEDLPLAGRTAPTAGKVVTLFPEQGKQAVEIGKMSASQRAAMLIERLDETAINIDSEQVYCYDGSRWEPLTDVELRREMAAIFTDLGAPFSDKGIAAAASTMKLMIPALPVAPKELIGFANGVYDLTAKQFRPHSPADGLLSHNGIEYGEPQTGETLEQHAPSFTKWLSHAAGGDAAKMARIKAALFMVLANRYDWQLFLEVTGEGGSGKSVMANLCGLLVGGENVGSSSMKRLESDFGLESVWDKRLILLPDQPAYVGDGATLKAITGGDEVPVNPKGKKAFGAVVRAVVMATNNDPMVMTERNGGIARRRVIFPFNNVVADADQDETMGAKIAAELPVIIRHLLAQFANPELARRLLLEQRDSAEALAVKQEADPVTAMCAFLEFLDEAEGMLMGGGNINVPDPRTYLYHFYLEFLKDEGRERALHRTAFGKAMKNGAKAHGREYKIRKSNGDRVTNVRLKEDADHVLPRVRQMDD